MNHRLTGVDLYHLLQSLQAIREFDEFEEWYKYEFGMDIEEII